MKTIFILSVFAILFLRATTTQAQDYFKERRYEGIDFTQINTRKYYVTIKNKKYEVVNKQEELLLGQKISFDTNQRIFYTSRQKKAMGFRETIHFMRYVGNNQSAAELQKSLKYYHIGFGTQIASFFVGASGFFLTLASIDSSGETPTTGLILLGTGLAMYGGGYFLYRKGDDTVKKTIRYHNKNVGKFSQPILASNDFAPSGFGFKPVRINLLNPSPVPTLSMTWTF